MKLAYEAYDKSGKVVHDTIDATDKREASDTLSRKGLFVTRIHRGEAESSKSPAPRRANARKTKRIRHMAVFARQLYVLVSSGTRIVEALEALELQTTDSEWRAVIADIRQQVEYGNPLSQATASHPQYFDLISQKLIAAGESTGKLPAMLDRVAVLANKQIQVRRTVAGALVYPTLLIFVSVGVLMLMLLFVLPRFVDMFETLKVPLPPTTQMLLDLSEFMTSYWWLVLLVMFVSGIGFRLWLGSAAGKSTIDKVVLKLPYLGRVMRSFATARIARLMGMLLDSHMPLLDVLKLIRDTTPNICYVALIVRAEELVTQGESISTAFAETDLISPSVCQMVRSGEQSGQIAPLLTNVAELMEEENEVVVRSLASILEPVILIVLGLLVGFVTLSMFIPLFDLTGGPPGAS
jgi:type II secretory pathway component PulF